MTTSVDAGAMLLSRVSLALLSNRITASLGSLRCAKPKHALRDCQQPFTKNFSHACAIRCRCIVDVVVDTRRVAFVQHRNTCTSLVCDARDASKIKACSASRQRARNACDACARSTTMRSATTSRATEHLPTTLHRMRATRSIPASHKSNCAKNARRTTPMMRAIANAARVAHVVRCRLRQRRRGCIRRKRFRPHEAAGDRMETKTGAMRQSSSSSSSAAYSSGVSSSSSWPTSSGSIVKIQPSPNASSLITSGLSDSVWLTATTLPPIGL